MRGRFATANRRYPPTFRVGCCRAADSLRLDAPDHPAPELRVAGSAATAAKGSLFLVNRAVQVTGMIAKS